MAEDSGSTPEQGAEAAQQTTPEGIKFALQRIYLKDLSFEAPAGIESLKQQKNWNPRISQDLNTQVNKVDEETFEVVLKMTVNVESEEKTIFLIEVQQAGLFNIANVDPKQLAHILNTRCPEMLFPYAREVIDSCAVKGGFPALMIPPINFDVLFMQAIQRAAQQQKAAQEAQIEKDSGATSN